MLVEQARKLPDLGATRVVVNDPTGALLPHAAQELVARIKEASELPVGFYVQGSAGVGLASALAAVDSGADLIATAVYPLALTLHRVSGESLAEALEGLGQATGLDVAKLWDAADVIDEWIGDEPVAHVAPRIAVRAAEFDLGGPRRSSRGAPACPRLPRCSRRSDASAPRPAGRRSPRRSVRSSPRRLFCTCSKRGGTAPSSTSSASWFRVATARLPRRSTRRSSGPSSSCRRPGSTWRIP